MVLLHSTLCYVVYDRGTKRVTLSHVTSPTHRLILRRWLPSGAGPRDLTRASCHHRRHCLPRNHHRLLNIQKTIAKKTRRNFLSIHRGDRNRLEEEPLSRDATDRTSKMMPRGNRSQGKGGK